MTCVADIQLDVFVQAFKAKLYGQNIGVLLIGFEENALFPFKMRTLAVRAKMDEVGISWDF